MRPEFSIEEAAELVRALYGFNGVLHPLPSYIDQNFKVTCEDGARYVLKITAAGERASNIQFQHEALDHVAHRLPGIHGPRVVPMRDGSTWTALPAPGGAAGPGEYHIVHMVHFLSGRFMAEFEGHPPDVLFSLGAFLGTLDRGLSSFEHEAMHRFLQWDLKQASSLASYLDDIDDPGRRALVARVLQRYNADVAPRLPALRRSVIHNDANDHNVLAVKTASGWRVRGIIDFGDIVYTNTVNEPAIAIAYMGLDLEGDVLEPAGHVLRGYHAQYPLTAPEIECLYDLICIRLCTSVCMSARQRKKDPGVAYLAVSEAPAWRALEKMARLSPEDAASRFVQDLNGLT